MKDWVKLYVKINHSPDVGTLTWAERGVWSALLALAGEVDERDENDQPTGRLDTPRNTAWRIRCDQPLFDEAVQAFQARNMIEECDGILYLPAFPDLQAVPPSSTRPAVNERVKRHRSKHTDKAEALQPPAREAVSLCNGVTSEVKQDVTECIAPRGEERRGEESQRRGDREGEERRGEAAPFHPDPTPLARAIAFMEANTGPNWGEREKGQAVDLVEAGVSLEWMKRAAEIADERGKKIAGIPRWCYIVAIINSWLSNGYDGDKPRASPGGNGRNEPKGFQGIRDSLKTLGITPEEVGHGNVS
jgi:hypothetical protein